MASEIPLKSPSEESFVFIFTVGQFLGVLPLEFFRSAKRYGVSFKWKSFKTAHTIFHAVLESLCLFTCFYYGWSDGWTFSNIVRTTFYTTNLWGTYGLFQLTKELPGLIKKWSESDMSMEAHYGYPKNLVRRTKLTFIIAFLYASCQTSIFHLYNYFRMQVLAKEQNIDHYSDFYFETTFPQAFAVFPYSSIIGFLYQLNLIFTYFRMVYIEVFISLLSSFLSLRFQQITERLNSALDKKRSVEFWRDVREDYDKVCNLCRATNEKISNIIFVSFTGNLILLLIYLRNCTVVDELNLQKVYNISAFAILLIREVVMLLYASWVNDESKEAAYPLNSVSSAQYNTEIQRFLLQVSFDSIAFTGNQMFKITKTLILNVGGIIMTYELVLVQFAELNLFS